MKALGGSNPPSSAGKSSTLKSWLLDSNSLPPKGVPFNHVALGPPTLGRVANQEKSGWTLRRFLNALKVSPPWARQKAVLAANALKYFVHFVAGNIEGIAGAPAAAKWGLMLRHSRRPTSMKLSPLPSSDDIWLDAVRAYETAGVWPISFSYPLPSSALSSSSSTICPVFQATAARLPTQPITSAITETSLLHWHTKKGDGAASVT